MNRFARAAFRAAPAAGDTVASAAGVPDMPAAGERAALAADACATPAKMGRPALAAAVRAASATVSRPALRAAARAAIAAALVMAGAAAGCGSDFAARWKEKLFPQPTAYHLVRIESDHADQRREGLQRVAADPGARQLPNVVKIFCLVARNDDDAMVRATAVRGLALMAGDDVVPTLAHVATHDASPLVRADACSALGRQPGRAAVQPLADVLRGDGLADVRLAAAEALRRFPDKAAAAALVAALGDPSLAVSRKAWESLRYMTGLDLPREARPWEELLAQSDNPFIGYGKAPPIPRGENQRPQFTRGPAEFIRGLFAKDVREAELE